MLLTPAELISCVPAQGSGVPIPGEFKHTSSLAGASFNFINSIIGAGIIGGWVGLGAGVVCLHGSS